MNLNIVAGDMCGASLDFWPQAAKARLAIQILLPLGEKYTDAHLREFVKTDVILTFRRVWKGVPTCTL